MADVIRYFDANGKRVIVTPVPGSGLTLAQIAARAVPGGISWDVVDSATVQPTTQELLDEWRLQANGYRRAFRKVLGWLPVSWAPTLAASPFASAPSLLVAADAYVATLDPYNPLRQAWEDVYEFLRMHPDMTGTQSAMQISDANMDRIFRACKVIDTQGTDNAARAELGLPPL